MMTNVELSDFENNFDHYFNMVADDKKTILITKNGEGYVVMMPYDEYQTMTQTDITPDESL